MAFCKSRGNEFVILFAFTVSTFSTLIHCGSLLRWYVAPSTNVNYEDQGELNEQLADFDYPIDDYNVSDLQKSAVTTSDEGNATLSDMLDQDFDDYNNAVSDLQRDAVNATSDEWDTALSDMSDQEGIYEQLADFDYPIDDDYDDTVSDLQGSAVTTSDEGTATLSDMLDQEGIYEQLADFDYPIDDDYDDTVSDLQGSAGNTTSDEGDTTLSDMSDEEGFNEQLADFDYPIDDDSVSDLQRNN